MAEVNPHDKFIEECQHIIGAPNVLISDFDKKPFLIDWSKRYSGKAIAVLKPKTTEEISALVRLCNQENIAITPQGGNTGLCGGATPRPHANSVVLSTIRLNTIREIDLDNATITVDAGTILSQVQEAALNAGMLFPLSLAAEGSCTIGGNLGTNAGGVQVLRYGNMRDLTLGLEVVTASGDILHGLRGLRKDNTGYSLKDLYIGSEGTLGIITAATLKLFPLPQSKATSLVAIKNIESAIKLIELARKRCNADLTAFELISTRAIALIESKAKNWGSTFSAKSGWTILLEFSSMEDSEQSRSQLEILLTEAFELELIDDAIIANSIQQSKDLWSIRESIPEAQLKLGTIIKHDISVPISKIADFVKDTEVKINDRWPDTQTIIFGHVGDGNLHYNLAPLTADTPSTSLESKRQAINELVHNQVYLHSGSFSAEHGIGQAKREELPLRKDAIEIDLMRAIKKALDPKNLMNPEKIL
ncbi:FAD-binding oxidoreductase [Polynucleobacter sp. MWH-UH2A]|uniref:FAD-binding oxidoreductase n=1 Tax=Polynucleobacter sp. MWH-UH2A TaxID=1855617 RepID=UPI00203E3A55|nr:FAD-binding oxidoreductase [Polynucleobacter sp. MWH-UH2A]